ncbi:MAG: hypothetical protein RL536_237 [Candidatus Parcubacteria bacterium]
MPGLSSLDVDTGSQSEILDVVREHPTELVTDADPSTSQATTSLKRGRKRTDLWQWFTETEGAHLLKEALCKHCNKNVKYHRKSELVKAHLLSCKKFQSAMQLLAVENRPLWFIEEPNKKQQLSLSSTNSRQTFIQQYALPPLSTKAKAEFQEKMAMHYYITGSSFQRIEDPILQEAIACLRPDRDILPSRKKLAGPLLEKCYESVKATCDQYLRQPSTYVCLATDGWSNIKNEAVVNYMAISPGKSIMLETKYTGSQGHTSEWISDDIRRVLNVYKDTKFAGFTDNTAANKSAWLMLKQDYPKMFFNGCMSHGLHLLVKDIFAASKVRRAGCLEPGYPVGYPFEYLLQFAIECKDIVKFFHNHHAPRHALTTAQREAKLRALVKPAPTRYFIHERVVGLVCII